MSSEWLTAESFERNHRLISAINTLSIYTKLLRAGVSPMPDIGDVAAARAEFRRHRGSPLSWFIERPEEKVVAARPACCRGCTSGWPVLHL